MHIGSINNLPRFSARRSPVWSIRPELIDQAVAAYKAAREGGATHVEAMQQLPNRLNNFAVFTRQIDAIRTTDYGEDVTPTRPRRGAQKHRKARLVPGAMPLEVAIQLRPEKARQREREAAQIMQCELEPPGPQAHHLYPKTIEQQATDQSELSETAPPQAEESPSAENIKKRRAKQAEQRRLNKVRKQQEQRKQERLLEAEEKQRRLDRANQCVEKLLGNKTVDAAVKETIMRRVRRLGTATRVSRSGFNQLVGYIQRSFKISAADNISVYGELEALARQNGVAIEMRSRPPVNTEGERIYHGRADLPTF